MADASESRPQPRIGLAALLGLGVAALVGSVYLLVSAAAGKWGLVDCADLPAADCQIARETRAQLSRMQTFSALALGLLALATFLFLRSRRRAA